MKFRTLLLGASILLLAAVIGLLFAGRSSTARQSRYIAAASIGDLDSLREFVEERGYDPNEPSFGGATAMTAAARYGRNEVLSYLHGTGADPNGKDHMERTPIMYAVMFRRTNTVELLLDIGANPSIVDRDGSSAVAYALNDPGMEKLLRESLHGTLRRENED